MFIESSPPRKEGDKARIVSTSLQDVRCLKFYYFMYGLIGMGKLRVYLRHSSGKTTLLWQRSGDQGQKWKKVQLPLPVDGSMSFKVRPFPLCEAPLCYYRNISLRRNVSGST